MKEEEKNFWLTNFVVNFGGYHKMVANVIFEISQPHAFWKYGIH